MPSTSSLVVPIPAVAGSATAGDSLKNPKMLSAQSDVCKQAIVQVRDTPR